MNFVEDIVDLDPNCDQEPVYMGDCILRRMLTRTMGRQAARTRNGKAFVEFVVGGQTVQELLRRVKKSAEPKSMWYRDLRDRDVVLMVGANNILRGKVKRIGHIRRVYAWFLSTLRKFGVRRVFMCTLTPMFFEGRWQVEEVKMANLAMIDLAKHYPELVRIVDCHHTFVQYWDFQRRFYDGNDLIHPNIYGLWILRDLIQDALRS